MGLFNEPPAGGLELGTMNRQGQDQGYSMLLSDHMHKPAFNATQPRFDYVKD